jgi:hypothetical protein
VSGVGSSVVLTRATDFDNNIKVSPGAFTFVTKGNENISSGYLLLDPNTAITIDTTPLNFTRFAGSGSLSLNSLNDVNVGTPDVLNNGRLLGFNHTANRFELLEKPGVSVDDLVKLVNKDGQASLPPVDGTNLTLDTTQISPLSSKGDLWSYSTEDTRLPLGSDGQLLTVSTSESTGLLWKGIASDDLFIDADATNITINFNTETDKILLGPLKIDSNLTPIA